jgi:hypothetical protein
MILAGLRVGHSSARLSTLSDAKGTTVKPGYTGHKKFVWVGQKKVRYKEISGILIPALIQIIHAQFC